MNNPRRRGDKHTCLLTMKSNVPHASTARNAASLLLSLLAFLLFTAHAAAADTCKLTVMASKKDATYKIGEEVTFLVSLKEGNKNVSQDVAINWTISKDGVAPRQSGKATLKNGQTQLTGKLDEAGFLQCEVRISKGNLPCDADKDLIAYGGAAIDPTQIKPSMEPPADFEAFWEQQKAALRTAAPVITLTPVETDNPEYKDLLIYDLQASAPEGVQVSGYLAMPKNAKKGSLPAILTLHGAGVGSSSLQRVVTWAKDGMLALDINAHGLPNGQPKEFYTELREGKLKNYPRWTPESRETSYFRGMFLRVVCALDILTERPEWDGKTLVTYGTSQGGAQALAAAGLDKRVSLVIAGVPAMCDQSGMVAGRQSGWPRVVKIDANGKPDAKTLEIMRYYDMMNFAPNIKVPVAMTVGFIDRTCAPTTVYSTYNNLGGSKTIFDDIPTGHANTRQALRFLNKRVADHVKEQAKK